MKQLLLLFVALWWPVGMLAQEAFEGKVIDSQTAEPLAFANIVFNGNRQTAVMSDIDGVFRYPSSIRQLECSYVGYRTVVVSPMGNTDLVVKLEREGEVLHEVAITGGESRANQIVRKVIAHKARNNPEQLASFQYKCYNKVTFDYLYNKNKRDSLAISQQIGNSRLLLMENVTERKYRKPGLNEETILMTRVSGFKRPGFALLATDVQPMSFYAESIPLFGVQYLNPIADGSLSKYHFTLEEEWVRATDTVFVVSFQPRPNKNIDGLKGVLYVNSQHYAVQNVIAEPFEKAKINIKIQQQYQYLNGQYWFPEQLNYTITVDGYPNPNVGIYSEGKSYLKDVVVNPDLPKKAFSRLAVSMDKNAMSADSLAWDRERVMPLSAVELQTYKTMDSIGAAMNFDRYLTYTEKLFQGKLPFNYFDLDLSKTVIYNKYEGFRLGTGFFTNERLSRHFTLGGFFGYGLQDHDWKYGGQADYVFAPGTSIGIRYEHNLVEMGGYGLKRFENKVFGLRPFIGSRYDKVRDYGVRFRFANLRYAQFGLDLEQQSVVPKYNFDGWRLPNSEAYQTATVALYVRYAFGEQTISSFGSTFSKPSGYPIVALLVKKGFHGMLGSDFDFLRMELAVEQSFFTKNFGTTRYRLQTGIIDQSLPSGQLFTGEGAYDDDVMVVVPGYFQTMRPYEFLSDRFVHVFASHNFGALLLQSRYFSPDISVLHHLGWGDLSHPERYAGQGFRTQEQVFLEAGLRLDNIVKLNYMNLGYLGLGAAGFYRYGAYAFPDTGDNLAFKITLTFSIR